MSLEAIAPCEDIDEWIRREHSFAIFRIPGEETPRLLMQGRGAVRLIYDIEELNGQRGFVIAPFRVGVDCPVVLIQADDEAAPALSGKRREWEASVTGKVGGGCEPSPSHSNKPSSAYSHCFDTFLSALRRKEFEKLVLTRSQTIGKPEAFSPSAAFYRACKRYVHSYVYLCYTPQTGAWLGSTPEIILSGEQGEWNTVALAGTQSLQNGELPLEWNAKNREEQGYVSSYIRRQLLAFGTHPVEKGPYPAYAGALSHLKTDFRFSLPDDKHLGTLLTLLHPTPAVCGLPKDEAYRFIQENEGYDRRYYSGFIGWLDPDGRTDLYVNLRCMHMAADALTLYAGGGLLASSELEDEWQETEKKLQTMIAISQG